MKPKFNIGQKVYYIPRLSGFNNKTKLEIEFISYKKDNLAEIFGMGNNEKHFYYSFKNSNLQAIESDLKAIEHTRYKCIYKHNGHLVSDGFKNTLKEAKTQAIKTNGKVTEVKITFDNKTNQFFTSERLILT